MVALILLLLMLPACDMFSPRPPEVPTTGGGTYTQPDAPDIVVENIQNAIAEMSVQNYRRSLSASMNFHPAASAVAGSPIFAGWGVAEEERYFSSIVASTDATAEHQLRFSEQTLSPAGDHFVFDALYVLTIQHNRSEAPPGPFQGQLSWVIVQDEDGLWRIQEWTDQDLGGSTPTWSHLKAAFG